MAGDSEQYVSLLSANSFSEEDKEERGQTDISRTEPRISQLSRRECFFLVIIILQIAAIFGITMRQSISQHDAFRLYSPAQEAVEYEVKVFTTGRKNKTIYQGLSEDVDGAWGVLYNQTIMQIPKSQAALLPNRTYPIKQKPGYYIAMLDVFHQLHCLNMIRQALHRDYYAWDEEHLREEHISHCVDSIRQSLMCNADISVNVWQWDPEYKSVKGHSTQAHTCKNFSKLQEWTNERRMMGMIEHSVFIEDDLPDPPVIFG